MPTAGEGKTIAARQAEIARRYAWHARQSRGLTGPRLLAPIRLRELERLFEDRWGDHLPDDDSGRDDLILAAHHIGRRDLQAHRRLGALVGTVAAP